jgi:hypothetical protein
VLGRDLPTTAVILLLPAPQVTGIILKNANIELFTSSNKNYLKGMSHEIETEHA